jgi:phage baseplate assembly protein W
MMPRIDYAWPFRIDPTSLAAAEAAYPAHVDQMVRQLLLTSPGERVDLPEFGCGLRQLVFAPRSEALAATARLIVQQALQRWLADEIELVSVDLVDTGEESIALNITYTLLETRSQASTQVRLV